MDDREPACRRACREPTEWSELRTNSLAGRVIKNPLVLSIPVDLPAFAEASRRHDYGNRVSETRVDMAVRRFAIAHALKPVVGVRFQIVALMQGCASGF